MKRSLPLVAMAAILSALIALPALADNYTSSDFTVIAPALSPGGGGYATSSSYEMVSTLSENAHDPASSASFLVRLGFPPFPAVNAPVVSASTGSHTGEVDLSWSAAIPYLGYTVAGYEVGWSTTSGGPYTEAAVGNVLSHNVTSLTNGTPYHFVVITLDNNGIPIATSTEISATPVAPSLTFVVDSGSQSFNSITPGTLAATSSILTVATTNDTGFVIDAARSDSTGTLALSGNPSVVIPDKTDWVAPVATTSGGDATASSTQSTTLQFRLWKAQTDAADYSTAWWGSDDTNSGALFAGIPSTTEAIADRSVAALSTTTMRVLYNVDVALTQETGTYSGAVVYSATANP